MILEINNETRLELITLKHAGDLFNVVNNNRDHLAAFLPWVNQMQTLDDFNNYIKTCELLHNQEKELSFVIISSEIIIGRIGLHHINNQNKIAAVGYWIVKNFEGKGIVSKCCEVLIDYGFKKLNLNRIEIKAAVDNVKSQAIPERLGFKKEGILRQAELVNNKFLDLYIYAILSFEWQKITANH